jgi:hypothetical protein
MGGGIGKDTGKPDLPGVPRIQVEACFRGRPKIQDRMGSVFCQSLKEGGDSWGGPILWGRFDELRPSGSAVLNGWAPDRAQPVHLGTGRFRRQR